MADAADRRQVIELRSRDPRAWAQAYDSYASDVFAFIAHLLHGDKAAAEEILQETWLAAFAGIDAFDVDRGEVRGWVFGIARRQVALHFRRQSRAGPAELHAEVAIDSGVILPPDVLAAIERVDVVRAALAELGAEPRDLLLAKYVDGSTVHDLAERFGRSPKAIESLLSRARARLRLMLSWYFEAENTLKD